MRDLVFKNLVSHAKRRRIITSYETSDTRGMRSVIQRHFICMVKEIKDNRPNRPLPYLYVFKEHDSKTQKKKFFCRIKGSVYLTANGRIYIVFFVHSLKITLSAIAQGLKQDPKANLT